MQGSPHPEDELLIPAALRGMRRFALDGALMLFDRRTGRVAVCDGPETAHLRMRAPRVVQFGITNACNLACSFCSRDVEARSSWSVDDAFEMLEGLSSRGTLEVAFGGGEPLAFKDFPILVERLFRETALAVSFTTNGTRLTDAILSAVAPYVAQVRVSVYDNVDHRAIVRRLAEHGVRFGINWLVTPERASSFEDVALESFELGCRDFLMLSYTGLDRSLHLAPHVTADLARRVQTLGRAFAGKMTLKLDICWGERMETVPQLFGSTPCTAGREFIVITSDRKLSSCSFHHRSFPVTTAEDVLDVWARERDALASPARTLGCARIPGAGLGPEARRLDVVR